ncbi:Serine/threonine-protein phosphatase PP1-2 [Tritrichomonas foetus]|uniref:Serine/threonine-protein phosphatase n=1 Tax=Tritrichomonas foetus TaxID=1144522 RepID=A0A1J4JNB6_9EUKA|nr:Serine/threonine-protein phosphatase PP1-2 [Tritrichomonas foetus]|eukprot:OHS99035.1 Serine/threonine-protein phosphatase PP1-2 [Tritrichomonas foetus]
MQKYELYDIVLSVLTSRIFKGSDVSPPRVGDVLKMIKSTKSIFNEESSLLRLHGEYTIVGDLHGNVDDLLRIFEDNSYPPDGKYVFTGDYVDRGLNSVEILLLLFALKNLYPEHIFLLRGNHESEDICSVYGFQSECEEKLGTEVFEAFIRSFSFMPFAAVINDSEFCVHGGICPEISELSQIEELKRPMLTSESLISNGILWSDPRADSMGFEPSDRGTGFLFNEEKLNMFLKANNLKCLIRSHESCMEGIDKPFGPNGNCITVFSNSDYCGMENTAAVIRVCQRNNENDDNNNDNNEDSIEENQNKDQKEDNKEPNENNDQLIIRTYEPLSNKDVSLRHVIIPEWIFTNNVPKASMQVPSFQFHEDDIINTIIESQFDLFYSDM